MGFGVPYIRGLTAYLITAGVWYNCLPSLKSFMLWFFPSHHKVRHSDHVFCRRPRPSQAKFFDNLSCVCLLTIAQISVPQPKKNNHADIYVFFQENTLKKLSSRSGTNELSFCNNNGQLNTSTVAIIFFFLFLSFCLTPAEFIEDIFHCVTRYFSLCHCHR